MGFLGKLGKAAKSLGGRRMRGRIAKVATGGLSDRGGRKTLLNITAPGAKAGVKRARKFRGRVAGGGYSAFGGKL